MFLLDIRVLFHCFLPFILLKLLKLRRFVRRGNLSEQQTIYKFLKSKFFYEERDAYIDVTIWFFFLLFYQKNQALQYFKIVWTRYIIWSWLYYMIIYKKQIFVTKFELLNFKYWILNFEYIFNDQCFEIRFLRQHILLI